KVHRLLIEHAKIARLVVGVEELFAIVNVVDIAPAAPVNGLHKSVLTDIGKDSVPVERVLEIAHGAVRGAFRVLLGRKNEGGRDSYADLVGKRVVEELVVRRPPERVVDDEGAIESSVLEV